MLDERGKSSSKDGNVFVIYYPGSDIPMYEVSLTPINSNCPYGPLRKAVLNFIRKRSGLCARVNDDVLEGVRGSAAMIDYIMRETLHGEMDAKFMYGSVDAVRSRVRIIQKELVGLAKDYLERKNGFRFFEAGHGFVRTKIQLLNTLKEDGYDITKVRLVGCDTNPRVVDVTRRIIAREEFDSQIQVHQGDAVDCLERLDETFDVCLAEGVFEYMDMDESRTLARSFHRCLDDGGTLIGTATHVIPKARVAKLLDFWFEPRHEDDFVRIFTETGFRKPQLIKTNPPNISVGIGRKGW
jgi:ubiquinone/menaquinone biosynthesis C-methylase UbiE